MNKIKEVHPRINSIHFSFTFGPVIWEENIKNVKSYRTTDATHNNESLLNFLPNELTIWYRI